jgi:hypothetical protein
MPGFYNPLWLLCLGIIPVIRWLHRWQAPLSVWQVSAAFLWNNDLPEQASGSAKKEPDPAWRRRALLTTMLVFVLAGPYWQAQSARLTVWLDDSLSLRTVEDGRTRLSLLLELLAEEVQLRDFDQSNISLRSLSNPARIYAYTSDHDLDSDAWLSTPAAEPMGPPAALMSAGSNHWLLSDGASEAVQTWSERVHIDRVLQVGSISENSLVSQFSARRSIADEGGLDVLISISNTGLAADQRRVALLAGQESLASRDVSLAAGETVHWQLRIDPPMDKLSAAMAPTDALPEDDNLSLAPGVLQPLATDIGSGCGVALRRAIRAHPALRVDSTDADPQLMISCYSERFPSLVNNVEVAAPLQIRIVEGATKLLTSPPVWTMQAGGRSALLAGSELLLAAGWSDMPATTSDIVLMQSGEQPLVVLRDTSDLQGVNDQQVRIVDTVIDVRRPQFIRRPEYAAFVAALVDAVGGRSFLTETQSASGDLQASTVIPANFDLQDPATELRQTDAVTPLSLWLLMAALLLLTLDSWMIFRDWRVASHA